ncbi:MAG: diguanylate cyclase domain-containing protein [bacterium]
MSQKYKIHTIFFLFALGLVISFILLQILFVSKQNIENSLDKAMQVGKKSEVEFSNFLDASTQLLTGIKKSQSFTEYLSSAKNLTQVQDIFLTIVNSQKNIMQLRYIDAKGLEKIRVERTHKNKVNLIDEHQLQNKLHRYYFQESLKQTFNQVWFSKLDLNVENKRVQRPYTPTLRAILPIKQQEKFQGIIVVNYYMEDYLNRLFTNTLFDMILFNQKGEILKHHDSSMDWSFYKKNIPNLHSLHSHSISHSLSHTIFRSQNFVSVKFNVPTQEKLFLMLKLKDDYLHQMLLNQTYHFLLIGFMVVLLSMIMSLFIGNLVHRLNSDLEQSKQLSLELEETQRVLNQYIDINNKHVNISRTDLEGKITYVSEAFCKISGYSQEELIGKSHSIVRHPENSAALFHEMWATLNQDKTWHGELKNRKKSGQTYWIELNIHPTFNTLGFKTGYIAIKNEITEKKTLEKLAITDSLTNLYNRRHFDELSPKVIHKLNQTNHLIAFIMIDIDCFKNYNDTYGHQMGDSLIQEVALTLKRSVSNKMATCFRLGGEEFGILLEPSQKKEVLELAETIRVSITKLKVKHDTNLALNYATVSVGVVCQKASQVTDIATLYKEADNYLYKAKNNGRNCVFSNL